MMTAMTYEELITDVKNNSKVIALIYSPLELHEYIVEIISNDSDKFIRTGDEVIHFHSIDSALSQCHIMRQKFDYIPIHSKYKRTAN